jgi:membrane protein implicated in regulation of membrane protease activity
MGLAYLFALVVGFGILLVQSLTGISKDVAAGADAHGELGAEADAHAEAGAEGEAHAEAAAETQAQAEVGADGHGVLGPDGALHADAPAAVHVDAQHEAAAHGSDVTGAAEGHTKDVHAGEGLVALFLSTRFWIFAFLGFGLSGSMLHYLFSSVSGIAAFVTALVAGLGSGLAAALAFRALRNTASAPASNTATAVGRVARVLLPLTKDGVGQVRIELDGQTVDLMAKTAELRIERGESVVIEEIDGDVAQVSKAPAEIER